MRRGLIVVCLAAVFAAAGGLGFYAATRLLPPRLEAAIERGLSEALETPVELGTARLSLGAPWPTLRLDATELRAWPDAEGTGHGLRIPRIHVELDPLARWLGSSGFEQVILDRPWVRLTSGDATSRENAASDPALADPVSAWVGQLETLAAWIRTELCPVSEVEVWGGTLIGPSGGVPLLADLQGTLSCDGHDGARLVLTGRSTGDGRATLRIDAEEGRIALELGLEQLELADWAWATAPASLRGPVTGRLAWRAAPGTPHALELAVRGPRLEVEVPRRGRESWSLALPSPAVRVELSASPSELRLDFAEWLDRGLRVRAEGRLGLPLRDESGLRLALSTEELDLGEARRRVAELPSELREPLEIVLERLETGRIQQLRIQTETTVRDWNELLAGRVFGRSGDVTLELSISDATVRVGDTDRMVGVGGELSFRGDVFEIRGLQGRFRDEPFPRIDARVRGLSNIHSSDELHCVRPHDVPPLPGLAAARDWLRSRGSEPGARSWQGLRVEADWISHPALLCTIEQLEAELVPKDGGATITVKRGVWAGLPVTATLEVRDGPDGHLRGGTLSFDVSVGPPFEPMQPTAPTRTWARGRFEVDASELGTWRIHGGRGRFEARGSRLEIGDAELWLRPEGRIEGSLAVELGTGLPVHYEANLQIAAVGLRQLWAAGAEGEVALSGTLHGAIHLEGSLELAEPPLANARGALVLGARDGFLHQRLPLFLAITLASDRWNPFGGRDRVAYQAIDLNGRIEGGQLVTDVLTVEASTFRMGASGQLGVGHPHSLEGVLGIFFFPTLDRLIDRLPIVNRVLLGSNRNLVGAYFALQGDLASPRAKLIPVKSLTAVGPASFMLEGLPGFVRGGIQRIQSVLRSRAKSPASPSQSRADS